MGRASRSSRIGWSFIAVCLCAATAARPAAAHTNQPEIPRHLVAGNQYFDASPAGFQAYLNTVKATNPELYTQLAPDADRLATRVSTARTILIAGFAAGLVSAITALPQATTVSCRRRPIRISPRTPPHGTRATATT